MNITDIFTSVRLRRMGAALMLCGAMVACEEQSFVPEESAQDKSGGISFQCADMVEVYKGENSTASRASGPKEEKEKVINTLHVFFFNQATGELMKTTNAPIGDIAVRCGYPNQLHFSQTFKKRYGQSPREWRKQNQVTT